MGDAPATAPAGAHSMFGLGTIATRRQRYGALAVCVTLLIATIVASSFGRSAGPEIKPFVPMTATIGSLADLLTAFLLIAEFYVNGSVPNGIFGVAYAFTGYMSLFPRRLPRLVSYRAPYDRRRADIERRVVDLALLLSDRHHVCGAQRSGTRTRVVSTEDRARDDRRRGRNRVVLGTNEPWRPAVSPLSIVAPLETRVDDHIFAKQTGRSTRADDVA